VRQLNASVFLISSTKIGLWAGLGRRETTQPARDYSLIKCGKIFTAIKQKEQGSHTMDDG
jgi:hypothetical protein